MNTTDLPAMPDKIAAALITAQLGARAVEKTATHAHHRYKYVRADDLIEEGRTALGAADLALMTLGWSHDAADVRSEGKLAVIGRVVVRYRLLHKSGQHVDWTASSFVVSGDGRPSDKAEMGAITENLSYTIRGLLMIPRVDEGASVETRDDRGAQTPAASSPRTAPATSTATSVDPAHDALATEFKRRIGDLGDLSLFGDLVRELEAAGLPRPLLDDVRAEIVVHGVRFAVDQEDLEAWVPKLQLWKLQGEARDRAARAWEARGDEIAEQRGRAA